MSGITGFKISLDMKKLIVLLVLLFVLMNSMAQQRFNLTFLASPQVSWLKSVSRDVVGGRSFAGFGYGVEGDFFLMTRNYAITTGLTLSSAGGSLTYNTSVPFNGIVLPAGTKVDYYLNFLEVPFALKMRTRDFDRTRYFAQFGLTNWFNISAKATTYDSARSFQKEAINDQIRFFNVGLNIGAGLEYELGHGNALTVGLIYSDGFSEATKIKGINDATTLKIVRLRLGFVF